MNKHYTSLNVNYLKERITNIRRNNNNKLSKLLTFQNKLNTTNDPSNYVIMKIVYLFCIELFVGHKEFKITREKLCVKILL